MDETRQAIEARAAELLARRESDRWSPSDEAELQAWLDASTAHRVAFLRVEAAWEAMGRLKALGAGLPRRTVPTPETLESIQPGTANVRPMEPAPVPLPPPAARRSYRAIAGIAASVVVAIGLALASYRALFAGERYATPVGAVASLPLADGSRMTLNSGSKVRVLFSERRRQVDLSQGEAFFEVAHDGQRPFVVHAGKQRIVAVGTQFSVRRTGDEVQVVVTEGRVRVDTGEGPGGTASVPDAARERIAPIVLSAGGVARARKDEVVVDERPVAEAEEILSWRSGYVFFRDTRLDEAVAEFNRYNTRQIVIGDPEVAAMTLTGKFRATNSDAFVNLLEQTYGVEVERTDARVVLSSLSHTLHE
jgi:transmembrane sensor